jgi:hypothetical protein
MKNGRGLDPQAMAQLFVQSPTAFTPSDIPRLGGSFVMNLPDEQLGKPVTIDLMKPMPMKHVGTGMLMVKRDVFEKFMKVYPDRWYEPKHDPDARPGRTFDFFKCGVNPETREYDSEDYWFIHDCKAMGYQALLCPWIKTTHLGSTTFYGDVPSALACAGSIF